MLYESKVLPKTALGVISVPKLLAEVPAAEHADVVESLRKALVDDPWVPEQSTLAQLLEDVAKVLDSSSGDMSLIPKAKAQAINDLCENIVWQFHARDAFFAIRSKLSEVLESQKP